MSAPVDLEQRARELLAAEYEAASYSNSARRIREQKILTEDDDTAIRVIVAALRQQPAAAECSCPHMDMNEPASNHGPSCPGRQPVPVDLEQFREAVECLCNGAGSMSSAEWARRDAERKRLLSIIDNAGKVASVESMTGDLLPCPFCGKANQDRWPCEWLDRSGANVVRCAWCHGAAPMDVWNRRAAPHQPAPVSDDASMARALEWVRALAKRNIHARDHLPAIEEAIAAWTPNCGARVPSATMARVGSFRCEQSKGSDDVQHLQQARPDSR